MDGILSRPLARFLVGPGRFFVELEPRESSRGHQQAEP